MRRRYQIRLYAFSLLFWALPASAQIEYDDVRMGMGANVSAGYNGDFGDLSGSDHGLGIGGSGTLSGSYYNPNFLSFSLQPYYNRSQSDSGAGQLFDTSGYNGNVSLFQGSNFPGSISFNQIWDSTGAYGIPGTTGLTSKNNNNTFAIGWNERVPGAPSLSVSYARGSGSGSVLGSDEQNEVTSDTFGLRSAYRIKGWTLGAGFSHMSSDANSSGLAEGIEAETTHDSDNSFSFGTGHTLPFLHGGFGVGYTRSDYNSTFGGALGGTSTGTTDNLDGNLSLQAWRFPINATAVYTDNLEGNFEEQQLSTGGTALQTTLTPETRSLLLNASTSYNIMRHVAANGFVNRQEMYIGGLSYGLTQAGGSLNFGFENRWKGLTATIGASDTANQEGNEGAGLISNVNYRGNVGHWEFGGNFGYYQNVQTMYAVYQTSSISYGGSLARRFAHGFNWSLTGGGGRTAFVQVAGSGSQAESVSTSLNWGGYTLGGSYSQSNGTSVVTPTGLVPVPSPVVSNNLVTYSGRGYGFGAGGSPIRGLSVSVSYSQSNSNISGSTSEGVLASINNTALTSGMLTYQFRKVYFNATVIQFRQGISSSGAAPSTVTSYYFGVSRWFKVF